MGDIVVRGVPDEELDALDARARRHGRTREAELRRMVHEAAREEQALRDLDRAARELDERLDRVERTLPGGGRGRRYRGARRVEPTPLTAASPESGDADG